MVKLPFIEPDETWESAPACVNFHKGDWHSSADRYRRWIDTWIKIVEKPNWATKGMTWETVVFNYPDDLVLFRFSDIPRLAREAKKYGVNVISLIGFHRGGMDRGYPDYSPDSRLGTGKELSQGISEANRLGVKMLAFVNIQVADVNTEEFKKELYKYAAKDRFGNQVRLGYGMHTFAEKNKWGYRQLALMCPSAKQFQDLIVERFKQVAELGFNGLAIDKVTDYGLCYDDSHGHKPAEAFSKGIIETLRRISESCRKSDPEFLISVEGSPPYLWRYANIGYFRLRDWNRSPICRYTFPEIMITTCVDQFDYHSVNNCLRVGYVINVEIHNMHETIASAPKLGNYIKEICRIRMELSDYLWNGQFRDTVGATLEGETEGVLYGVHINKENRKKAVVLMNASETVKRVKVVLEGSASTKFKIHEPFANPITQHSSRKIAVKPARVAVAVEV